MPTAPMLRGRSFITPVNDTFRDMAAALVIDRYREANPISFEDRAADTTKAIANGTLDPVGLNSTTFEKAKP